MGSNKAEGTSVNLPLIPYTFDQLYQEAFEQFIPTILETFDPDFIIWQAGVDGHAADTLGHLLLTTHTYQIIGEKIRKFADHFCEGRLIAAGGGGYSPYSLARSWFIEYAALTGLNIPKETPQDWQDDYRSRFKYDAPKLMHDKTSTANSIDRPEWVENGYQVYKDIFIEKLSPYYNLKGS